MIDDVEKQIYETAHQFAFVNKIETILKTTNTLKIKLVITSTCFIQIYQNIQKGVVNYAVILGNQRIFGRDCDGGIWHCHPVDDPGGHDFSEEGSREVSLKEFLYEAAEKLLFLGIL